VKTTLECNRLNVGEREMYLAAAEVPAAVQIIDQPVTWDALAPQPHGNRVRDKDHVAAIVEYLRNEPNPILGALVIYPRDVSQVSFRPADGADDTGLLEMDVGTVFDVGDGQHRLAAMAQLVGDVRDGDLDDPLRQRIYGMKIPLLVVRDDDPARRAQDFVDLQRNAKPPSGSLGTSMDRRHAINRFTLDVAKSAALFDGGTRIEFLSDTVGARSSKLYSFQALRQAVGILLVGSSQRTRAGWEAAADAALNAGPSEKDGHDAQLERITQIFDELAYALPGWSDLMDKSTAAPEFRKRYLHATAAGLYSITLSIFKASADGIQVSDAVEALSEVDWERHDGEADFSTKFGEGFFDGTLLVLDPRTQQRRTASGRPSWEAAADQLHLKVIKPHAMDGQSAVPA
jgi:DGQHR domain-containing protein